MSIQQAKEEAAKFIGCKNFEELLSKAGIKAVTDRSTISVAFEHAMKVYHEGIATEIKY